MQGVQLRIACACCAARKIVEVEDLRDGHFRCTVCERLSGIDVEALHRLVHELSAVLAAGAVTDVSTGDAQT